MSKFSESEEEDLKNLGSDEEFFGGVADSDEEEEKHSSSKKKSFDAFANSDDEEEEDDDDDQEPTQASKINSTSDKEDNKETEEDKNVKELYRKSKLAKFKASKKPKGKTGVVYISRIPPYMKPTKMRQILSRFGDVDRLFLKKEDAIKHKMRVKNGGNKKPCYEEGWAEFIKKRHAKTCAEALNGNILGGKKGNFYHDDIMNVKYLSGFKWADLTAQMSRENESRQSKLQLEINQGKKLNSTFIKNVEQSKMIANIQKKKESSDDKVRRTFDQRAIKTTRADGDESQKKENNKNLDSVLSKVF